VQRRTIYSWLTRLDTDEPLEQAVTDAHRSRKNRKLSEREQEQFKATVHEFPEEVGLDAPASTPALVQQYLDETYDVEYSIPSCRRLLKEAGLSYQKPRRTAAESDADDKIRSAKSSKKRREMDAIVVCIDQTKKSVQVEPRDFLAARGRLLSYPVNATGRVSWARSPKTEIVFSLDSKST